MSRDSGSDPSQRTVAELLAEYGGGSQRSARRRRRRAEDPSETAPQAIIERVMSDSGQMRPVNPEEEPPKSRRDSGSRSAGQPSEAQSSAGSQEPRSPNVRPPGPAAPQPEQQAGAPQGGAGVSGAQASGPQPVRPPGGQAPASNQEAGPAQTAAPGQPPAEGPPVPPAGAVSQPPSSSGAFPAVPKAPEAPAQAPGQEDTAASQGPQQPPAGPAADQPAGSSSGFWARRFGAASKPPAVPPAQVPGTGADDAEATLQQLPLRPQPFPRTPGARPGGERTEQLPKVDAEERNSGGGNEATTQISYPQGAGTADPYADADPYAEADPYADADPYGELAADSYAGAEDSYGYGGYDEFEDDDEYDPELPAGMGADDYRAGEDGAEGERAESSPSREWFVLTAQVGTGLVAGGAVWFAFRWLWTVIPLAALVAALLITGCLVFIARKYLRTDDLQTILLAVLVGLICTVSPAALLLIGQ